MTMEAGEWAHKRSAIESLEDAGEDGFAAVPHAADTPVRGRGSSKPAARIVGGGHEESNLAR